MSNYSLTGAVPVDMQICIPLTLCATITVMRANPTPAFQSAGAGIANSGLYPSSNVTLLRMILDRLGTSYELRYPEVRDFFALFLHQTHLRIGATQ